MQNIVIDKPYHFVPPVYGKVWPQILKHCFRWHARRVFGIEAVEMQFVAAVRTSFSAGRTEGGTSGRATDVADCTCSIVRR